MLRNRMLHRWAENHEGPGLLERTQHRWENMAGTYLNTTRIEGVLAYENGTYSVDGTTLYLGNELFMQTLARSDFDRDGSYESVQDELADLAGTGVVVNGVLRDDVLYVSHVNGIFLRLPRDAEMMELSGVLEKTNETFYVGGTELALCLQRISRSDIDGDGNLERLGEEMDGLVGEYITVDGTMHEGYLVCVHVNGIWIR
jgi:hypothetical protein